jgi:hypothetical protein
MPASEVKLLASPPCTDEPIQMEFNTSAKFRQLCTTDLDGNDLGGNIAYTFRDCLASCVSYNRFRNTQSCVAVTWNIDMGTSVRGQGVNCFLKRAVNPVPINKTTARSASYCDSNSCDDSIET